MLSQIQKDLLLKRDIEKITDELKFMYSLDQGMRNYFHYETFSSYIIDSINHNTTNSKKGILTKKMNQKSKDSIWKHFINPIDAIKTERFVEIISKYGFPSLKRLNSYNDFKVDFNPLIILIHSPFHYAETLLPIIEKEYKIGNIDDQCDFGYLLWHFNGRSDFKYMLENGYKMEKNEDGTFKLIRTCE